LIKNEFYPFLGQHLAIQTQKALKVLSEKQKDFIISEAFMQMRSSEINLDSLERNEDEDFH